MKNENKVQSVLKYFDIEIDNYIKWDAIKTLFFDKFYCFVFWNFFLVKCKPNQTFVVSTTSEADTLTFRILAFLPSYSLHIRGLD